MRSAHPQWGLATHRGCLRGHRWRFLLAVLAGKVRWAGQDDHNDRRHDPHACEQPVQRGQVCPREHAAEEPFDGIVRGVDQGRQQHATLRVVEENPDSLWVLEIPQPVLWTIACIWSWSKARSVEVLTLPSAVSSSIMAVMDSSSGASITDTMS